MTIKQYAKKGVGCFPTKQGCCFRDEIVLMATLQFPPATFFQFENPAKKEFLLNKVSLKLDLPGTSKELVILY